MTATAETFAERLLRWFDNHGRKDLPWQRDVTPYRIWLSEVMLQQTQVGTVIPYFERFVAAFPTVEALAAAPIDQVLQYWSGLGYYARARHLHHTAQIVVERYAGELPVRIDELMALPGIGRSTAGAILAIALQQRAPILDGNVKRVLARHRAIDGWPGQANMVAKLWQVAEACTPPARVAEYTQAIMDLGATLCVRTQPACSRCPLAGDCAALSAGTQEHYPGKKPRRALPVRALLFLVLHNTDGRILLLQRPPAGLWGGLWSFPECASSEAIAVVCGELGCVPQWLSPDAVRRHTFSHYHLDYTPVHIKVVSEPRVADANVRWITAGEPPPFGLPAPVARLLAEMAPPAEGVAPSNSATPPLTPLPAVNFRLPRAG